jgi:hypothetical protein
MNWIKIVNSKKSSGSNLLLEGMIPLFISFQDILKAAQHSLEALPVNRGHPAPVNGLDTGLSADVVEQSQLSEVVPLLVLVDDPWEFVVGFLLFGNQVTLQHDVKLVSAFTLLDDVLSPFELFFLQDVVKLLSEVNWMITFLTS